MTFTGLSPRISSAEEISSSRRLGNRHHVDARFVTLGGAVFHHAHRGGNLVQISRHAHHVDDAVLSLDDVRFVVGAPHVRHDGNFQRRIVVAHHRADILFVAELIFPEFGSIEGFFRRFIAEFHVIHTRGEIHLIERFGEIVAETEIVHEPAVAQRRVEHLYILPEREERAFSLHHTLSFKNVFLRVRRIRPKVSRPRLQAGRACDRKGRRIRPRSLPCRRFLRR